jgi:hypothetical protein
MTDLLTTEEYKAIAAGLTCPRRPSSTAVSARGSGKTFDSVNPATGEVLAQGRGLRCRRRGFRRGKGARRLRGRPLVAAASRRAQGGADPACQADEAQRPRTGGDGKPRQRQDDLRLRNRRPARDDHCLIWHAEADRQDLRSGLPRLRRPYRDDRARTRGRRGARPAVELPASDAGVEDRPGAGRGLFGHRETGRGDLADGAPRGGTGDGGGRAARGASTSCRARAGGGRTARAGTWMSTWSPSPARPRPGGGS